MDKIKFFIVSAMLLVIAVVSLSSYLPARFETGETIQMANFPMKIGAWVGKDIALTQRDFDILETKNLIMREYSTPAGQTILLYIVYSTDNRKALHPPEVCYLGSGATIAQKEEFNITSRIKANKMVIELPKARQVVAYWYKAADMNTPRYFDQQLKVSLGRLIGKKTSAAMIRVSVDMPEGQDESVMRLVKEFAAQVEPLLPKYVP